MNASGQNTPSVRSHPGGCELPVHVVPGASRTRVRGVLGDRLKVQVAAAPERGRANAALCHLLAGWLSVRRSDVSVVQGASGPRKSVAVAGLSAAEMTQRLGALLAA